MSDIQEQEDYPLHLMVILARAYNAVMTHSNRSIQSHGLNSTEFGVLDVLYHKGPQPLQKIGEKVLISSGNITYVVDKLQKKNLLVRRASAEDRRVIYAELTPEGKAFFESIFPGHQQLMIKALSGLTDQEKAEAVKLLKKLGRSAEEML
ncbi:MULTISPECIES: MarR family transcriptional regulator [Paenibacillus]|uniref:Transcriptional regulator, MarR family n=2 Tax=Paenibacillus lactis TaxID=228574 RepID=G4HLW4_9BACL|nr:MarR family transcriptional regulator [Paenibacillus lactis]EHB56609.1 transcriptional regulator, MarR family [Paenibacillus lactis 154]MBP1893187.1 MarR family 2-MHQ and catechol resistance regulon transcriptional repressor [Paenibacillus lactis]MCM3496491.1 MarR family transcriptional regulator [Paenibacillus lactis]GIO90816.1 MarR family transcriptional regulator [Paenibacillus lactis]HAG01637.1 MarR family transcriptional regulator [Paenibacillus lactis]